MKEVRYFFQLQCQIAVARAKFAFFCIWSRKGEPHVEVIPADYAKWSSIEGNLVFFFKTYVATYLLGAKSFVVCPICGQLCLEEEELTSADQHSVCCDVCNLWFHWNRVTYSDTSSEAFCCPLCSDAE